MSLTNRRKVKKISRLVDNVPMFLDNISTVIHTLTEEFEDLFQQGLKANEGNYEKII